MLLYENLQKELLAAFQTRRGRLTRAAHIARRLSEILQKKAGFPEHAIKFRSTRDEPEDKAHEIPDFKVEMRGDGTIGLIVDVYVENGRGEKCAAFSEFAVKFLGDGETHVEVSIGSASSPPHTVVELIGEPETDNARLAELGNTIYRRVKEIVEWVATGKTDNRQPLGFHT